MTTIVLAIKLTRKNSQCAEVKYLKDHQVPTYQSHDIVLDLKAGENNGNVNTMSQSAKKR